jgi:beta-glucanase (GH16 family)
MALWDEGPSADQSQYNEINLGCTTGESSTNTQMDLVSTRLGQKASLTVDASSDLYDGSFHTGKIVYDSARVEFYLDDELLGTITDTSVIPTDPLTLILGTRLVTTPVLTSRFDQIIDSCEIEW